MVVIVVQHHRLGYLEIVTLLSDASIDLPLKNWWDEAGNSKGAIYHGMRSPEVPQSGQMSGMYSLSLRNGRKN